MIVVGVVMEAGVVAVVDAAGKEAAWSEREVVGWNTEKDGSF